MNNLVINEIKAKYGVDQETAEQTHTECVGKFKQLFQEEDAYRFANQLLNLNMPLAHKLGVPLVDLCALCVRVIQASQTVKLGNPGAALQYVSGVLMARANNVE